MRAETNATWAHTPRLQGGVPLASAPPPAHPQPVEGKSRALILLTHTCNNEAALSNPCSALATTRTKGSELGRWRGDGGQGCDWRLAARAPRRCTRPLASATPAGHAEPHARHVPPDGALPRPLGLQMPCSSCRGDPRNLASPPHPATIVLIHPSPSPGLVSTSRCSSSSSLPLPALCFACPLLPYPLHS